MRLSEVVRSGTTLAVLLLACTPASASSPPGSAPASSSPAPTGRAHPVATPAPRADGSPPPPTPAFMCRVDVEIRDAGRAQGTAASDQSSTEAHDLAWRRACDDLRARSGLDCENDERVRVVKRSSSTRMSTTDAGTATRYEQSFELVGYRLARGEAGSDESFAAACTAAADRACRAALGEACPEGRVVVLRAQGDDPGAKPPPSPPSRRTI